MKTRVLNRHLLAGVGLVALMAASPAIAASSPPPPAPVDMWSWSGVYVGGHAGYGWARDPFSDAVFADKAPAAPPLSSISANGFLGGFQAGANWQAGSWVGGLEIDFSATHISGSSSTTTGILSGGGATAILNAQQTDRFDWLGSGRVRLGYLPLPNVMLYGTGGPAWTRILQTDNETGTATSPAFGSISEMISRSTPSWRFGVVAGVGAEVRLGQTNWLGRVEYLHYDFGKSNTFTATDPGEEILTSSNMRFDVLRAGLSYMLGGDGGGTAYGANWASAYAAKSRMPVKAMPVKAPIAAPWTWAGFYIGAHAGYGWGHDPFTDPENGFDEDITLTGIESRGFLGGFQAGANWQNGVWVGGLELDLSATGIKGTNTYSVALNDVGETGTDTLAQTDRFDLLGSARARIGYLPRPDVLVYGTGGLAWTRMTQTLDETVAFTSGGTSFATSTATVNWEFGWVAGIGVETRLWNTNWLGRIEYLHYDFGDSGSSFDGSFSETSGNLTVDLLRAGLSYKLDWSNPAGAPAMMPVKAPVRVASSWSGFYLGGHVGYGWGHDPINEQISVTGAAPPVVLPGPLLTDIKSSGFLGGFQAGANRQMGAVVAGLELDLSATGIKGSTTGVRVGAGAGDVETDTDRFDTLGSARARLGYLAWPNVLLYGTGGLAWTRFVKSIVDTTENIGSSTPSWQVGWVAGAGAETRLWDSNWFWRLEYLHYDFGDSGGSSANITATNLGGLTGSEMETETTGHLTTDVVRTGLSFKLN